MTDHLGPEYAVFLQEGFGPLRYNLRVNNIVKVLGRESLRRSIREQLKATTRRSCESDMTCHYALLSKRLSELEYCGI